MRGPAPKPTALVVIEGNPGHRPINRAEPRYRAKLPKAPAHLTEEARGIYRRLGKMLLEAGVLQETDGIMLAELAQTASALGKAWQEPVPDKHTMRAIGTYSYRLVQLCREFGLTPASRTRIQAVGAQVCARMDEIESALC